MKFICNFNIAIENFPVLFDGSLVVSIVNLSLIAEQKCVVLEAPVNCDIKRPTFIGQSHGL